MVHREVAVASVVPHMATPAMYCGVVFFFFFWVPSPTPLRHNVLSYLAPRRRLTQKDCKLYS